jgi:hypothetical protein
MRVEVKGEALLEVATLENESMKRSFESYVQPSVSSHIVHTTCTCQIQRLHTLSRSSIVVSVLPKLDIEDLLEVFPFITRNPLHGLIMMVAICYVIYSLVVPSQVLL